MNSRDDTAHAGGPRSDGTIAAIIRVRAPSGKLKTLAADTVEISGPFVNATGHWRDDPSRRRATFTWPAQQLVEVRWSA